MRLHLCCAWGIVAMSAAMEELVGEVISEAWSSSSTETYSEAEDAHVAHRAESEAYRDNGPHQRQRSVVEEGREPPSLRQRRPSLAQPKARHDESPGKKSSQPKTLDELHLIIEEGEREAMQRIQRNRQEMERRERAFLTLPKSDQRRFDKVCDRILRSPDYYATLRIGKRSTSADVKRQYRTIALTVHPDRNPSPKAPDAFDKLTDATETLLDPASRRNHDRRLRKRAVVRRTRFKRRFKAFVQDTVALVDYRSRDRPGLFYGALLLVFALLLP